jgi:isopentenyl phosphate kinase
VSSQPFFLSLDPEPSPDYNKFMDNPEFSPTGDKLVFLKLGGSLITDKHTPRTARIEVIERIVMEIKSAQEEDPALQILLGHGSGSFGHYSGKKHKTRDGVTNHEEWLGFAEVWYDAASLNQLVIEALRNAGISPVSFPPSAAVFSSNREITSWDLNPVQSALEKGLLPVVFGDVAFDSILGGTILSTEDLFVHLARNLRPGRILLAGQDPGVWQDFPDCKQLFDKIIPSDRFSLGQAVSRSEAPDVTGGMAAKVEQMLLLIEDIPEINCSIFSGEDPGNVKKALLGQNFGTLLAL